MLRTLGFAIDMEVVANGESFFITGDDETLVVSFASLRTARRLLPLLRNDAFKATFPTDRLAPETAIETRVSGRTIALSGREIKSSVVARLLGLQGTRFFLVNLLRSIFASRKERR